MPLKVNPSTGCLDLVMGPGSGTATVQIAVDDNTAPGTNPVLPTGAGQITVSGAAVSAHSIPVETHSRASNEFNVEVQVGSAVTGAPGNTNSVGLVQFDDTAFDVDINGYVTLKGGSGPAVDTFNTDVSGPVSPDGSGVVTITGTSVFSDGTTANTIDLNVQATANTFLIGAGVGSAATEIGPLTDGQLIIGSTGLAPVAGSLSSTDGSITITPGPGTIDLSVAAGDDAILTVTADSGGALSPTSGNINILGGTGVTTSGTGSTLTIDLDSPVSVSNGGTGTTTLTDGGILLGSGTSAVTVTSQPTNGQLLIGSTGVDPVLASLTQPAAGITITGGAGSITFALANDLAAIEGLGSTGFAVRTASDTWAQRSIASATGSGIDITNGDGVSGNPSLDIDDDLIRKYIPGVEGGGTINIGVSYSSPTFTIHSADGSALSSSNPGFVIIPSNTIGRTLIIEVTSNFSFEDDTGTSNITGNTFGTTAGVAWTNTMPMYIYFVLNDAETDVTPMLCRVPHLTQSPSSANIGTPASAVADTQSSMWCLESITTTEWDSNSCVCVGSIQMYKNDAANDDWTVYPFEKVDGIGQFKEGKLFTFTKGQNGAVSTSHFYSNPGTEPEFTTENYSYQILKSGYLYISITYFTCSTSGVGADSLAFSLPLQTRITNYQQNVNMYWMNSSASSARNILIASCVGTKDRLFMWENGGTGLVTNALFSTNDRISAEGFLNIDN